MSLATSASTGSVRRHGGTGTGPGSLGTGHSSRGTVGPDSLSRELGHGHHGSHRCSNPSEPHHHDDGTEWEAKEELRQRELEEARARAAQMEKTMRWWSDCTANWREKWSKVRTERNKAREEVRLLRTKLEAAVKDNVDLRREKVELEQELQLERRTARPLDHLHLHHTTGSDRGFRRDRSSPSGIHAVPERDVPEPEQQRPEKLLFRNDAKLLPPTDTTDQCDVQSMEDDSGKVKSDSDCLSPDFGGSPAPNSTPTKEFFDKTVVGSSDAVEECSPTSGLIGTDQRQPRSDKEEGGAGTIGSRKYYSDTLTWDDVSTSSHLDFVDPRLCELQLRLDEASKTVQAEREEKSNLHKTIEKMHIENSDLKIKYEELKILKQDALKELSQVKSEHQDELDSIRLDLEDEANTRSSIDRRLADLRTQLERLQTENAAEWGKRERLETEKLALERENKKLRTQIEELEERIERKSKSCASGVEADAKTLQHELHDRSKELADLRHSHGKLKKALQEKTTELAHASRRAEQYETEVKKLRCRVEELKKELATAEDEVDNTTNNLRKVQRQNDELQEQVDSLQVQVDHLQTRLRNNSHSLLALRGSNSLLNDGLSEDENGEF